MMQDYEEALKCFQGVMKIESTNRAAYQQIQACRQKIKQQREKDKKLYANMFEKLSRTSTNEEVHKEPIKEESPVKDSIAKAVEDEEISSDNKENEV
jgi:hypothetical protein